MTYNDPNFLYNLQIISFFDNVRNVVNFFYGNNGRPDQFFNQLVYSYSLTFPSTVYNNGRPV